MCDIVSVFPLLLLTLSLFKDLNIWIPFSFLIPYVVGHLQTKKVLDQRMPDKEGGKLEIKGV
jgi:hypothetical protein